MSGLWPLAATVSFLTGRFFLIMFSAFGLSPLMGRQIVSLRRHDLSPAEPADWAGGLEADRPENAWRRVVEQAAGEVASGLAGFGGRVAAAGDEQVSLKMLGKVAAYGGGGGGGARRLKEVSRR